MLNLPIEFIIIVLVFLVLAILEIYKPWYQAEKIKKVRWLSYIGLYFFNMLILRIILPITVVACAIYIEKQQYGLLNIIEASSYIEIIIGIILLDFMSYVSHRLMHIFSPLWRLHRVHHADTDYDVATHFCHHPLEFFIGTSFIFLVIGIFGIPVVAVLIFTLMSELTGLFTHSNIFIPKKIDQYLRLIMITPAMHRTHHSDDLGDSNSNFGTNFPWWDYVLNTYRAHPIAGYEGMKLGVKGFKESKWQLLPWILVQPFYRTHLRSLRNFSQSFK